MRIAINTRLLVPGKLDGIGWFIFETVRRLVRDHPEVEFHLLFDRAPSEEFRFGPNVHFHHILPPARRPILFRWWLDYSIPLALKKLKADIFLSPDGLGSTRSPIPQLVVIHDINFERYPEDLPAGYAKYLRQSTRRLAVCSTRLATVSEFSRNEIGALYKVDKASIDIIPNGVNALYVPQSEETRSQVRATYSSGHPYFLFVSSIHPRKNLPRLLEAYDQFRSGTEVPFRLLVVGTPFWMEESFRAVHEKMTYADDVVFTGRLGVNELARVMGAAHALTYVSYYEGFGIPLLEAFSSGVPVLSGNQAALPEVAGEAALYADPFSVQSIATGLELLAFDDTLRSELITKGFERVKKYSWELSAGLLWDSIERTISTRGHGA